jgi:hypothetical protein
VKAVEKAIGELENWERRHGGRKEGGGESETRKERIR